MPQISALMIDSREPEHIKNLKFGGLPTMVTMLDTGDIQAVTDDGCTLIIERKTQEDFLNTLKDDRLFPQMARMVEIRNAQIANGEIPTYWAYLVIVDAFYASDNSKVITNNRGVTGWSLASLEGTLLTIQEMGINIVFADGENDYENCILRIGRRNRNGAINILSPRPAKVLGPQFDFLTGIQGIEITNSQKILDWCNGNLAHGMVGFVDLDIPSPVPMATRRRFRKEVLKMQDSEKWELVGTEQLEPITQGEK